MERARCKSREEKHFQQRIAGVKILKWKSPGLFQEAGAVSAEWDADKATGDAYRITECALSEAESQWKNLMENNVVWSAF